MFEYRIERLDTSAMYMAEGDIWHSLNELGQDGWELVSVWGPTPGEEAWGFFKRQTTDRETIRAKTQAGATPPIEWRIR